MADAAAYLKLGKKIQCNRFGRAGVARVEATVIKGDGYATTAGNRGTAGVDATSSSSTSGLVVVQVNDAQREIQQLPMKRKRVAKRSRCDSDEEDPLAAPLAMSSVTVTDAPVTNICEPLSDVLATRDVTLDDGLNLANVASPTAPVPPVEGVAQRTNLMAKWFPAFLQERKLDAAVAPSMMFVEATVERVNKMREYVLILRYGIEDVESLLEETRQAQSIVWNKESTDCTSTHQRQRRECWDLTGKDVRALVRSVGLPRFTQALAEFSDVVFNSRLSAAAAVYSILSRRRRVGTPMDYNIKAWHEYLNTHGPQRGYAPRLSDLLWLSAASTSAMFTATASRLLRGARSCTKPTSVSDAAEDDRASYAESENDSRSSDRPRFFDNTENAAEEEEPVTTRIGWLSASVTFPPTLSPDQRALLSFLRFLMPTSHTLLERTSSAGYGVWLFAAFSALDIPLDPDTDRLAHDLFRTCCRHLRTLADWQGVSGSTRDLLLRKLHPRTQATAPPLYASLDDICREDVLALYTIVVVLARFFRQNQDHFIPL
ncbi:Survival motor neuron (SMN) interacting protein 1 (SIP1), putative [Leishmania lindenbergi]|uniref:Survival motor neuron (SMN) interacting protein 1 (SIP1) n=1 Tax=Leishmania lindenbergi TaxID=651832 RepID=A0AAW2ZTJ3_9TRYP